jgi:pSer/pThr/pTyr-binding forkhead associated (FHA) protein
MKLILTLTTRNSTGDEQQQEIQVDHSGAVIGRVEADITVPDPRCSRRHAMLYQHADGTLRLKDLESANGTFIRGVRIRREERLYPGDEIGVGDTTFELTDYIQVPA